MIWAAFNTPFSTFFNLLFILFIEIEHDKFDQYLSNIFDFIEKELNNIKQDDDDEQSKKLNFPEYLNNTGIHKVWYVTTIEQNKEHFVVICDNASHLCTCMWLVMRGLVCHHFF